MISFQELHATTPTSTFMHTEYLVWESGDLQLYTVVGGADYHAEIRHSTGRRLNFSEVEAFTYGSDFWLYITIPYSIELAQRVSVLSASNWLALTRLRKALNATAEEQTALFRECGWEAEGLHPFVVHGCLAHAIGTLALWVAITLKLYPAELDQILEQFDKGTLPSSPEPTRE